MRLKSLSLTNFRNYEAVSIHFHQNVNLIIGGNSQGKTNLLEAIKYLSVPKSYRTNRDHNLIKIGQDFFKIAGLVESDNHGQIAIVIVYAGRGKNVQLNNEPLHSISDLIGYIKSVSLFPEDTHLTRGPPVARRRFINLLLSQVDRDYLHQLQEYNRVLSHRNRILGMRGGTALELRVWNEQLVKLGSPIIVKRARALKTVSDDFERFYERLANREQAKICYIPSVKCDNLEEGVENNYRDQLNQSEESEWKVGFTLMGPHRDDLSFQVNDLDLRFFGSQGQHRTALIALKLAEAQYIRGVAGEAPLTLWDDPFSGLDRERISKFVELLGEIGQAFVTTAREAEVSEWDFPKFLVANGQVYENT